MILLFLFMCGTLLMLWIHNDINLVFNIYNINKMFLWLSGIIFYTHLNESFNTKDRLEVFAYAFFFGKTTAVFAPFVTEYLSDVSFYIIVLTSSSLLMLGYSLQKETLGNAMLDD